MNNSPPFSKSKSEEEEEEKKLFCWSLQPRRGRWTINKLVWKLIRERERWRAGRQTAWKRESRYIP